MKYYEYKNQDPDNEMAKSRYDSAMDGTNVEGKGLHMSKSPYIWRDRNLIDISYSPVETFVPTPTINTGEKSSAIKRALKIGVIALVTAAAIGAFIWMLLDDPSVFDFQQVRLFIG